MWWCATLVKNGKYLDDLSENCMVITKFCKLKNMSTQLWCFRYEIFIYLFTRIFQSWIKCYRKIRKITGGSRLIWMFTNDKKTNKTRESAWKILKYTVLSKIGTKYHVVSINIRFKSVSEITKKKNTIKRKILQQQDCHSLDHSFW